MTIVKTELKSC